MGIISLKHQVNDARQSGYIKKWLVELLDPYMVVSEEYFRYKKGVIPPNVVWIYQHHFEEKSSTDQCHPDTK